MWYSQQETEVAVQLFMLDSEVGKGSWRVTYIDAHV